MAILKVGTSGYNYKHWADGVFYPEGLPQNRWLEFYSQNFDTVELNVTFYRLPNAKTFSNWYKRTPEKFEFVLKGSRFITHIKKLEDCKEPLELFFLRAGELKEKLKVVLWQLPPSLKIDLGKMKEFFRILSEISPKGTRHAFEFRDKSWFCEEVYEMFKGYNHALCIADSPRWPLVEKITADFVYLRFHGGKVLYGSEYSMDELKDWASKIKGWLKEEKNVYAFFNNDAYGFAVKNARQLKESLTNNA